MVTLSLWPLLGPMLLQQVSFPRSAVDRESTENEKDEQRSVGLADGRVKSSAQDS